MGYERVEELSGDRLVMVGSRDSRARAQPTLRTRRRLAAVPLIPLSRAVSPQTTGFHPSSLARRSGQPPRSARAAGPLDPVRMQRWLHRSVENVRERVYQSAKEDWHARPISRSRTVAAPSNYRMNPTVLRVTALAEQTQAPRRLARGLSRRWADCSLRQT